MVLCPLWCWQNRGLRLLWSENGRARFGLWLLALYPAITTNITIIIIIILKVERAHSFKTFALTGKFIQNYEEKCEGKGHPASVQQSIEIISFFKGDSLLIINQYF